MRTSVMRLWEFEFEQIFSIAIAQGQVFEASFKIWKSRLLNEHACYRCQIDSNVICLNQVTVLVVDLTFITAIIQTIICEIKTTKI